MQVNGTGMQNMHQYRYGASNTNGNSQMKDIMQSLSPEDRETVKSQLQSLPKEDRQNYISQITQLDYTSMDSAELTTSIMDILGVTTQTTTTSTITEGSTFSTYA